MQFRRDSHVGRLTPSGPVRRTICFSEVLEKIRHEEIPAHGAEWNTSTLSDVGFMKVLQGEDGLAEISSGPCVNHARLRCPRVALFSQPQPSVQPEQCWHSKHAWQLEQLWQAMQLPQPEQLSQLVQP